ncbi:MAG: hypothetical protein E6K87_07985 [Thaumarchaeota archaeon]|nr:MAG: hypothetical protein E6K87_07985 [Nitrososphaerota archaeon]
MIFARRRHRALSTVVTTAMLLTAVVAIGTGLVAWANTNSRTFESILVSSAADKLNTLNEMLIIENVTPSSKCPTTGLNGVNTTVTNTGTMGINVTKITVSDATQSQTFTKSGFVPVPQTTGINPHASKSFCVVYNWQTGFLTTVQVTTGRNTLVSTQVMK